MKEEVYQELRGKKELTRCKVCNKRIWLYWNRNKREMTKCAPCYFNKKNVSPR